MLTFTDTDEFIKVTVGEPFTIVLHSIPATGYVWQISSRDPHIECLSQQFVTTSRDIGAGGQEIFKLQVTSRFSGEIVFEKKREWEDKVKESCRFHIEAK